MAATKIRSLAGTGTLLRERRLALGLSQKDLAQRAGVAWSTYRAFERGYRPAFSPSLHRVWDVLYDLERNGRFRRYEPPEIIRADLASNTKGPEGAT
jgi:transcriptional regulator with XRE-family HTH domain